MDGMDRHESHLQLSDPFPQDHLVLDVMVQLPTQMGILGFGIAQDSVEVALLVELVLLGEFSIFSFVEDAPLGVQLQGRAHRDEALTASGSWITTEILK